MLGPDDVIAQRATAVADRRQLGGVTATYLPVFDSPRRLAALGVTAGCLAALMLLGMLTGFAVFAIAVAGVPAAILAVGVARSLHMNDRKVGAGLCFFEHGLVVEDGQSVHAFRWDETVVHQLVIRHIKNGMHTHTTHQYTLKGDDGSSVTLREGFAHPERWGPAIQQAVTDAQLPGALAAIDEGRSLDFGRLALSRDSFTAGRKSAPWSQIHEIEVRDGSVWVSTGPRHTLATVGIEKIPNFALFMVLADHLHGAAPR